MSADENHECLLELLGNEADRQIKAFRQKKDSDILSPQIDRIAFFIRDLGVASKKKKVEIFLFNVVKMILNSPKLPGRKSRMVTLHQTPQVFGNYYREMLKSIFKIDEKNTDEKEGNGREKEERYDRNELMRVLANLIECKTQPETEFIDYIVKLKKSTSEETKGKNRSWNSFSHGINLFEPEHGSYRKGYNWHEVHNAAKFIQIACVMIHYLETGETGETGDLNKLRLSIRRTSAALDFSAKRKINNRNNVAKHATPKSEEKETWRIICKEVNRVLGSDGNELDVFYEKYKFNNYEMVYSIGVVDPSDEAEAHHPIE